MNLCFLLVFYDALCIGGMGKRAWNSGFTGGMGKRAWNSGFNGGMGKRAWNRPLMASDLGGFRLYTEINVPLPAKYDIISCSSDVSKSVNNMDGCYYDQWCSGDMMTS